MEQCIDAQKAALQELEGQPGIDSEALSQAIIVFDVAQGTLTPAEFARLSNYVNNVALGGQAAVALQSALNGDYDEVYETTFDAAVPFAIKPILTKIAPRAAAGLAGGSIGIGVSALSLVLAFTPLDTSGTRVAAVFENSGEINERGQRIYPGSYGTRLVEVMNGQIPVG